MSDSKQVDKAHYEFNRYMSKERWISIWHQLDEIQRLHPKNVLEIGPGPGLLKEVAGVFDIQVETLDLDPELKPDHVGSATAIPLPENAYDLVCAFQVLEHLPYEESLVAFKEMVRVSESHVIISLPDAKTLWRFRIHLSRGRPRDFFVPRPRMKLQMHKFDGEHYWEINKLGFSLARIKADLSSHARLIKSFRVIEMPYHHFFVFAKQ
jgi:hypothetical protein